MSVRPLKSYDVIVERSVTYRFPNELARTPEEAEGRAEELLKEGHGDLVDQEILCVTATEVESDEQIEEIYELET